MKSPKKDNTYSSVFSNYKSSKKNSNIKSNANKKENKQKLRQKQQLLTQYQQEIDISIIKSFVKFCTDRQHKKLYINQQTNRLKNLIPKLKQNINEETLKKTQAQTKLVTMQVTAMNQLENINTQTIQINTQLESLFQKTQQNQIKVKTFQSNKILIQKLNKQLEDIKLSQKQELNTLNETINNLKKQKVLMKAEIVSKNQETEHLYLINQQKKIVQQVRKNKIEFQNYFDQLNQIMNNNKKQRQQTIQNAKKLIKDKSKFGLKGFQQKINDDIGIINKKMNQTQLVQDFRSLLKFANIPLLQYIPSQQQQFFLKFYKQYYPLQNLKEIKQDKEDLKQSLQDLSIMESSINSQAQQMQNLLKSKDQQVNLMQSKYSQVIMKLMTLTDRSSHSFK